MAQCHYEIDDDISKTKEIKVQCQFYVIKKKRYCRMTVKKGEIFCGEHIDHPLKKAHDSPEDESRQRVPCPYDINHSCFKHQLRKHTARCNSKPPDTLPPYIIPGLNKGSSDEVPIKVSLLDSSDQQLMDLISRVHRIHDEHVSIGERYGEHAALTAELSRADLGPPARKHLVQNSSLLALLQERVLLEPNTCFLEMGAGKGKLTYWLAQAVKGTENCRFALVDRASHRHKSENKLKTPEETDSGILRLRADIADLCLLEVPELASSEHLVVISKHLCGAATDLALRCATGCLHAPHWEVRGVSIATCCHHRCDWTSYTGKRFFEEAGLSRGDFALMTVLASWATCGSGRARTERSTPAEGLHTTPPAETAVENKHKDRYDRLNLPQETRELVGRKCKYLIDWGRIKYLETLGMKSDILFYVPQTVTLENVCILATL